MGWEAVLGGLGTVALCLIGILLLGVLAGIAFGLVKLVVFIRYALTQEEPVSEGSYSLEQSRAPDENGTRQ